MYCLYCLTECFTFKVTREKAVDMTTKQVSTFDASPTNQTTDQPTN